MNRALFAITVVVAFAARGFAADAAPPKDVTIAISGGSMQINGVELRIDPPRDIQRFLSLPDAEKALGKAQDNYRGSSDVRFVGWHDLGIQMLVGLRNVEKDKIFKCHIWFVDDYDKASKHHSGTFKGHVHLDGADIGPETTFDQIRDALQKNGWAVGDYSGTKSANKGEVSIFTVSAKSDKIQRIQLWCRE